MKLNDEILCWCIGYPTGEVKNCGQYPLRNCQTVGRTFRNHDVPCHELCGDGQEGALCDLIEENKKERDFL